MTSSTQPMARGEVTRARWDLRPSRLSYWQRDALSGYAFVAPQVLGFGVFVLGPLLAVFWFSLQDYNSFTQELTFNGLDNYERLVADGTFRSVLRNTAVFSFGVVPANVVLGIGLAVLVNQNLPGIAIFRTAYFIPVVISLAAWSLVWDFLLQDNGGVNAMVGLLGGEGPNWLQDPDWALATVVFVQVVKMVGISMVLFLAALQGVPAEVLEAARVDGASPWRVLRHIALPLISPTILLVSIIVTIWALKAFAQIFLLTEGGPGISTSILGYYVYVQAFEAFQVGYASAVAVVLFAIVLVLTVLQWRARTRWVFDEV